MRKTGFALALGFAAGLSLSVALAARNSSGTYSLPSGNPVVSGTVVSSTWANNTLNDIKTEVTDSLSRSGKGAMLAALELVNGTVGTPALSFDSDTDTGLYRIGANNLGVAVGGVKVVDATASMVTLPLGATVTQATANAAGLVCAGNGTGNGITTTGGSTGIGGHGIHATGGGSEGSGVYATASGASSLAAIRGVGGAGNYGLDAIGGTGIAGGRFRNGSSASGGTRQTAIIADNGDISLSGVTDPDSTTSVADSLTPVSFSKLWANITYGSGTPSVNAGLNVASVSCATSQVTVTVAGDFASANYSVIPSAGAIDTSFYVVSKAAGSFVVGAFTASTGAAVDLCAGGGSPKFDVVAFGAQ
jgi:hypothetical protein